MFRVHRLYSEFMQNMWMWERILAKINDKYKLHHIFLKIAFSTVLDECGNQQTTTSSASFNDNNAKWNVKTDFLFSLLLYLLTSNSRKMERRVKKRHHIQYPWLGLLLGCHWFELISAMFCAFQLGALFSETHSCLMTHIWKYYVRTKHWAG